MRLIPFTSDAVLISTVLAGIRRAGNFEYPLHRINSTTLRWLTHQFLFVGELCLDLAVEIARHHPKLFPPRDSNQVGMNEQLNALDMGASQQQGLGMHEKSTAVLLHMQQLQLQQQQHQIELLQQRQVNEQSSQLHPSIQFQRVVRPGHVLAAAQPLTHVEDEHSNPNQHIHEHAWSDEDRRNLNVYCDDGDYNGSEVGGSHRGRRRQMIQDTRSKQELATESIMMGLHSNDHHTSIPMSLNPPHYRSQSQTRSSRPAMQMHYAKLQYAQARQTNENELK
ncbi:hypothetical protein BDEG_23787 [Batrachochytrium dendrobatidis JEL423]|uniref:Uncharacterized protein n=2 Tax=Batrachochytrium dendrobatidis TaxID=109871 RepID=A0A177WJP5_BATDL|nr:hypothetical protein BDEG_23787 [Batrachochytrium dendrobatidis JEL423]